MNAKLLAVAAALAFAAPLAQAQDAAEVDAVVAAVKSANPNLRQLCQGGPDAIRKASTDAVMKLMGEGKIKGNPQQVGGAAGGKIGQECRG
ncbi:MAG: hypothetical protein IPK29_03475 [Betaproteobacteria bacterium]|jgi:hypothetical protein|nr:hypothetical protein [Betaproteobacteria bacterium]